MNPFRLIRCSAVFTFIVAAVAFADSPDVAAAIADRNAHYQPADYKYISYLSLRPHVGQQRTDLERAIKLVVASDSTQPILERCVPVHVNESLLRIDIRDLRWRYDDWYEVAYTRNPYALKGDGTLVVPAAWLLSELSDLREGDSYNRLIFGGDNIPKTKDDVFKFFGVAANQQTFGFIEGKSGVSVQGVRLIQSLPIPRTWAWITSDVKKLDERRDPLQNLAGYAADGQEGIIGLIKQSSTTGQQCGLQFYWLNNAKGAIVAEAPADLVVANPTFRQAPIIAPPGACIQCHQQGAIDFTKDAAREFIQSGANIYANKFQTAEIEAAVLSKLDDELRHAGNQFTLGVVLTCGCAAVDAAKSYQAAINLYDAPLNLEQTAAELGVSNIEWTQTLAKNGLLTARLASLPHGGTIPRASWEEQYADAFYATHGGRPIAVEQPKAKPVVKPQTIQRGRR